MCIKSFSSPLAHASIIHMTAMSDDRGKRRQTIRNKLRKAGICGADAALSCLAGMLSFDEHVRKQSMRCLLLLDYSDLQVAMACIPKNSSFMSVIDIFCQNNSLPFSEIIQIITVRCGTLNYASSTDETSEKLLKIFSDFLLEKELFDEMSVVLDSPIGCHFNSSEIFGKFFDALTDSHNEAFLKLVQIVDPETLAKDSERFPKVLKRLIKVEMGGYKIQPKLFYTRILPALQSFDCTLLSSKEMSYIPYNIFHLFNAVEGDYMRRCIFHKILESTPTFCIGENAETLPNMGLFVRNPSYGFKILLSLQAMNGNASRIASRVMTDICSMYKQCRWISESLDSALTSYLRIPHSPMQPKRIEQSVRMLMEMNFIETARMADILISAFQQVQRTDAYSMLDAVRVFTKLSGFDRSDYESFAHRSILLMGPVAYLIRTSNLPGKGRGLRTSIIKFFIYTNFQSFLEIAFQLAQLYVNVLEDERIAETIVFAGDIRSVLLNLLYLTEGISSKEVELIQKDLKSDAKKNKASGNYIPCESFVMNMLGIIGTTNTVHTRKDIRDLVASRNGLTCDWVLQKLLQTFDAQVDTVETSIETLYQKFTIFTPGWADKPFTESDMLQQTYNKHRDAQRCIDPEIEAQKTSYAQHLGRQISSEQLVVFFRQNALARIKCSYSEALATFYFFLQHIALNTYVTIAIDLVDKVVSLTGSEANCLVFFIRCTLDEMRRSVTPSVQAESPVLLKSFAEKFTHLITDHSMSLESVLNICTLAKETMAFICSSAEAKKNVVEAISAIPMYEPQAETTQALLVLKAAFENHPILAVAGLQSSQSIVSARQDPNSNRSGYKRDRYTDSSKSYNNGRYKY